jgi:diguanylate cyclase (GGDEF)-like protein
LIDSFERFDDWIETHRGENNPWPKFDDFLRSTLYECCQATHVRPYRLAPEGRELIPLTEPEPPSGANPAASRSDIVDQVLTTGRSYLTGEFSPREPFPPVSDSAPRQPAWCFPILGGARPRGVVVVGRLATSPVGARTLLSLTEKMVTRFWRELTEVNHLRRAVLDDPATGLYNRGAFFSLAEESLAASYDLDEPAAVAVIAVEGLRDLNDSGRWEIVDELLREVGAALRRKVRRDDRLGRFDGSRFVVLLRRVDADLSDLIARQMLTRVREVCEDCSRRFAFRKSPDARCGLATSDAEQPNLRALLARALTLCHQARTAGKALASDVAERREAAGVPS